jgi:hypothetical protein
MRQDGRPQILLLVQDSIVSDSVLNRYCAVHARASARNPSVKARVEWLCVQGAQQ